MEGDLELEHGRLSEAKTKAAFGARDWAALKAHLDDVGVDDSTLDELLGHLQRASGLILRYPDAKRETRQGDFLENLGNYIRTCRGEEGANRVAAVIALLATIQRGYRSILATLESADISKIPPSSRGAACLEWSIRTYHDLMKAKDEAVQKLDQMRFPNGPFLVDKDGGSLSVDAAINAIVCSLSATLVMEAHRNAWKDP